MTGEAYVLLILFAATTTSSFTQISRLLPSTETVMSVNEQVLRKLIDKDRVILPEDDRENVLITSALPCESPLYDSSQLNRDRRL